MWEVFFFGTAFSTDSQISPSNVGMFKWIADGIAKEIVGRVGRERCLEKTMAERLRDEVDGATRRGRKEESIEVVEACTAAIVMVFN